jgi:hypothetical protein
MGVPTGTPLTRPPLIEAISEDPILCRTKLIAEAWDCGPLMQVRGCISRSKTAVHFAGHSALPILRLVVGMTGLTFGVLHLRMRWYSNGLRDVVY